MATPNRACRFSLLAFATLSCALSGCLFVRHSTRIVREKEAVHPIRFESDQAKTVFEAGVHQLQAHKETFGGDVLAVPFVCWRSHVNELSDNAVYNDQESACDLNGDGFISLEEALAYRAKVEDQVTAMNQAKAADATGDSKGSTPVARRPNDLKPPPGLIH
ncbi:MAG: hypothetical protein ABFC96_02950 [Thermoguttaceae bacterium]